MIPFVLEPSRYCSMCPEASSVLHVNQYSKGYQSPPSILHSIKAVWSPLAADWDFVMLWAACCMGFFGFMRAGEFTAKSGQDADLSSTLSLQDVSVDRRSNPSMVKVLRQSKTDPLRHGVAIYLGRTGADICPDSAILAYIAVRPSSDGPLFIFKDEKPHTRERLVSAVRQTLTQAGIPTARYSGHSFRIGAATAAAQAGIEDSVIKMLGRWNSFAYQRYIRTPRHS